MFVFIPGSPFIQSKLTHFIMTVYQLPRSLFTFLPIKHLIKNTAKNMNTLNYLKQYQNWSLQQILDQQLQSQTPTHEGYGLALAKARLQSCNPQSLSITLHLFDRYGIKWLHIIERFAQTQFQLVFSFCIQNLKTYPALIKPLYTQGDPESQTIFETNIENALDGSLVDQSITFRELWDLYIQYLRNLFLLATHRTISALTKIENRLTNPNNIYLKNIAEKDLVQFIHELARIIRFHEQTSMKKLQLRKFWNSISSIISFLKDLLSSEGKGLIEKLILTLQTRSLQGIEISIEQRKAQQKIKEDIVLFFSRTCEVSILQETYLHSASRLAKELANTYMVDYWNYKEDNADDLILLENSLIYEILSDDLPSLIQQLLCSLAKQIPSFLTHFLRECSIRLFKDDLDEISTSDIVLKLCILSKEIIQHTQSNEESINIKQIVSRMINLSDSRSELVQIKTLKMMHYFREILPDKNFISYHEIIFRVIKKFLMNEIGNCSQQRQNKMQQMQIESGYRISQSIYTKISYNECIKILEEETEPLEEPKTTEMRIRKAKFSNSKIICDFLKDNQTWISDKFLDLISIDGYCFQQSDIFNLYRNFIAKYPSAAQRSTSSILNVLSLQFIIEFQRLRSLISKQKEFQKLFEILNCIILVADQINQDTYMDCEECLIPVLTLLKEPYQIEVEKQLLKVLQILIDRANMITPELSNLIVYTQEVLKKDDTGMSELGGIIEKLCKDEVAKSMREEWSDLIVLIVNLFMKYIIYMVEEGRVGIYQKEWSQSINLAQMWLQTYESEIEAKGLGGALLQMQFYIEKILPSEAGFQLMMTIHHIEGKSKIYSFYEEQLVNVEFYQQRYSVKLVAVTLTDILVKNFRERIFEYEESQEAESKIKRFVKEFAKFRQRMNEVWSSKQSSPNDSLPLGKIDAESYLQSCLESLHREKLIDISEVTELKSILLRNPLLPKSPFQ